jgi:hypothetical protein
MGRRDQLLPFPVVNCWLPKHSRSISAFRGPQEFQRFWAGARCATHTTTTRSRHDDHSVTTESSACGDRVISVSRAKQNGVLSGHGSCVHFGVSNRLIPGVLSVLAAAMALHGAELPAQLVLQPAGAGLQLRLPRDPIAPVVGTRFKLNLEASSDLKAWAAAGELGPSVGEGPQLTVAPTSSHQFFRLRPEIQESGTEPDGADLFGYNRIFQEELRRAGFLKPADFAATNQPSADYLSELSFDPTTAKYWPEFAADPAVSKRPYDFRLNDTELALFKKNGFVVSERLGSYSFADVFYRILSDDLPVFISADAILHAWHFSYQRLLEESEETQLAPALQDILDGMHARLSNVPEGVRQGPLQASIKDADYYLAVARSLLSGKQVPTFFDNDAAVANTLRLIAQPDSVIDFEIFGANRLLDFSQFAVRGHYERSEALGRYFRTFMWTARVDFRMLAAQPDPQTLRELGTAIVLCQVLEASGQAEAWRQLDDLLRLFVGRTDAMTFAQLQPLLQAAQIMSLDAIKGEDQLRALHQQIVEGRLGTQLIVGDAYIAPFGPEQLQLPRAFVLTGQRFNADGWALGQVIFDGILWNEEIPGYTLDGKVLRRYCSALDMAYTALANHQIGWVIAERMLDDANRTNFRDGLPYAHNLVALANTFERLPTAAWQESIYVRWLAALRELSRWTTGTFWPEAMRTRAWALRMLNAQLASYTELKHDTVLYAKQPYTGLVMCEYPAGFVEPNPAFWVRMQEMATSAATNLARLPASGGMTVQPPYDQAHYVDFVQRQAARVNFCSNFASQMAVLAVLASKECLQQPFTDGETTFVRSLMNRQDHPYSGPTFDGWYPSLFYKDYGQLLYWTPPPPPSGWYPMPASEDTNGSDKSDPLVTDVHTAPPDMMDPVGGVLHEGTGNPDLLMIAVDNGPDRMVYAGPVMSHYEFILPGPTLKRMTDSEWKACFSDGWTPASRTPPPRPDWTRSYLVPR